MVAVLRRAGRIVGGQIVKGGRDAPLVEVIPEGNALPPQHGGRGLVVERPEGQLHPVLADVPVAVAGQRLGAGEEGDALLFGMPVDEVEDAVRARPRAVDEAGPGHGALRRDAGAQRAEPAVAAKLVEVGHQAGVHHPLGQAGVHAVDADDDHALVVAAAALARPAAPGHAEPGSTRRGCRGRSFQHVPAVHSGGILAHA